MMTGPEILIGLTTTIASIGAVVISYKSFRVLKTLENENHFFKYKIEQYQQILIKAYRLLDIYLELADEGERLLKARASAEELNHLAYRFDRKTDKFQKSTSQYALFIPENILLALGEFYNDLYGELVINDQIAFKEIYKAVDEYYDKLSGIVNLMREDIGIENLNFQLKARINKN